MKDFIKPEPPDAGTQHVTDELRGKVAWNFNGVGVYLGMELNAGEGKYILVSFLLGSEVFQSFLRI